MISQGQPRASMAYTIQISSLALTEKKYRRIGIENNHVTAGNKQKLTTPNIIHDSNTSGLSYKKNTASSQLLATRHGLNGNHSHAYATTVPSRQTVDHN